MTANVDDASIMLELQYLRASVDEIKQTQKQILRELGGNGGPGLRARVFHLETEQEEVKARLAQMADKDNRRGECLNRLELKINRIQNIGAGIGLAVIILEALRWIVPLFTP